MKFRHCKSIGCGLLAGALWVSGGLVPARASTNDFPDMRSLRDAHDLQQFLPVAPKFPSTRTNSPPPIVLVRPAQEPPNDYTPLLNNGLELQRAAENVPSPAETLELLQRAAEQFHHAALLHPERAAAYALWSESLLRLARNTTDPAQRHVFVLEAQKQFANAARCNDADWSTFANYGEFLIDNLPKLGTPGIERLALITEAATAFESGLKLARFSPQRAQLQRDAGLALFWQGDASTDLVMQQKCYTQAAATLATAAETQAGEVTATALWAWGTAKLRLAKLDRDPKLANIAAEKLRASLEKDPLSARTLYTLACAEAMLGRAHEAVAHLRQCIANDADNVYRANAVLEPDLKPLKYDPEFQALLAAPPPPPPKPPSNPLADAFPQLLREGLDLERQSGAAPSSLDASRLLISAIEKFTEAVKLHDDIYIGHALWSECLLKLAQVTPDTVARRKRIQSALDRFAKAVKCPGVDWNHHRSWGQMLLVFVNTLAEDQAGRAQLLTEARRAFESGVKLARFNFQRAQIQRDLGFCLVELANATSDPIARRLHFREAIEAFDAAADSPAQDLGADTRATWGMALLQAGRMDRDVPSVRRAVEQFQKAADLSPNDPRLRYSLAVAHAFLNQTDDAVGALKACFERDRDRFYFSAAPTDPDLQPLAGTPEFKALFQTAPVSGDADKVFQAGVQWQQRGDSTNVNAAVVAAYQNAIDQFSQATQLRHDFGEAHARWAACLVQLARRTPQPLQRRAILQAARERFATAQRCQGVTWATYDTWGNALLSIAEFQLNTTEERKATIDEARQIFETGRALTNDDGARAKLECQIAVCLVRLADQTADPKTQRTLYEQAVAIFGAHARLTPDAMPRAGDGMWGLALFRLAKMTEDREQLRQATDHFEAATAKDPTNALTHYNLACCYALMNRSRSALQHLRAAADFDPQNVISNSARVDPDLASVRTLPEFTAIVGKK